MKLCIVAFILFVASTAWAGPGGRAGKVEKATLRVLGLERTVNKDQEAVNKGEAAVKADRRMSHEYDSKLHDAENGGDSKGAAHYLRLLKHAAVVLQKDQSSLRHSQATRQRDRFRLRWARRALREMKG